MGNGNLNNFNVLCKEEILKEEVKVEVKTDISTEQIEKILGVSAKVLGLTSKVSNGILTSEAKVNFQICYVENGEIKKAECVGALQSEKQVAEKLAEVRTMAVVYKEDADFSGIKLSVSAVVSLTHTLFERNELEISELSNELCLLKEEEQIFKSLSKVKSVYPVEEEFEVDFCVKEMLSLSSSAVLTAVQCGVNTVIVDGEIYLYSTMLQNGEKRVIIKKENKIPFRAELEYPDASPENSAVAFANVRSFKTDIAVDVEENKSTITASVILDFDTQVFVSCPVELVKDAFSTEKDTALVKDEYCYYYPLSQRCVTCPITEKVNSYGVPEDSNCILAFNEKAEVVAVKKIEDGVMVTGVISFTTLLESQGKLFTTKNQVPFEKELLIGESEGAKIEVTASISNLIIVGEKGEWEVKANLIFSATQYNKKCGTFVKNVELKGDKKVETSAISVYIAKENESLFSLAKRLNLAPETIKETNSELTFPLDKSQRIVIYRKI